jgi:glutathione S-transferase
LPTFTPFGLKLIAYMRLAGLPFETVVEGNPSRGPHGKVPWIEHDGQVIPDSAFILEHLERRAGRPLDAWLSAEQAARAHALRRMVEEGLCFSILYTRWVDDATYQQAVPLALAGVPRSIRSLIAPLVRRRILRDLRGQGVGRLDGERAARLGCLDLDAMATQLRSGPYALGDRVCSLDAVFWAFLSVILSVPLDTPLKRHAQAREELLAYLSRLTPMLT